MRKVGASAKEVFIKAASARWEVVDVSDCFAENGKVIHKPTNKTITYGDLVADASKLELPKEPKLKDPKDFKILGKMAKRPDVPLKTNGSAQFGIDVHVPGNVICNRGKKSVIGGTLKSFDAADALKIPGVEKVVPVERAQWAAIGSVVVAMIWQIDTGLP